VNWPRAGSAGVASLKFASELWQHKRGFLAHHPELKSVRGPFARYDSEEWANSLW
jgi:hypothetical protein